jgi:hypothetical protein
MNTITFDTLKYAKTLQAAGVTDTQAEAMAQAQRDSLAEALESQLATKADVKSVKEDLAEDIAAVKADITGVKADIVLLKWMLALVVIVTVVPALKAFFA